MTCISRGSIAIVSTCVGHERSYSRTSRGLLGIARQSNFQHRRFKAGLSRQKIYGVQLTNIVNRCRCSIMIQMICMIVMFSMRISRDSRLIKCHRNRWRDPAYSGTEVINPATSQLRPCHTRCRKKDQSDGDPDSYLSVQATGAEVLVLVSLCIAANITFPPPEQNPPSAATHNQDAASSL